MGVRFAVVIVAMFVLASALSVPPASASGANGVFSGMAEGEVHSLNKPQLIVVLNERIGNMNALRPHSPAACPPSSCRQPPAPHAGAVGQGRPCLPLVLLSEVRPSALRTAFPLPAQEVLDLSHQLFRVEFFASERWPLLARRRSRVSVRDAPLS